MSRVGLLRGMNKNVLLLGLVSLATDASSEIIMPILPMYISTLGGAGLAVGLIGGLGDSASSIINILSGHLSDRFGRKKPFVFLGYGLSAIMKLLYPFSRTWPQLLIFRVIERIGKGIRSAPRDALIAQSTLEGNMGKAFGLHRALDTSGAIGGSILAFVLFWFLGLEFRAILLIAGLAAFISLLPLPFVEEERGKPTGIKFSVGLRGLSSELRFFILVASIFAMANFTYMFFILRAQQAFTDKEAVGFPILLYVLFNTVYALLSIPAGSLSDRVGRKKVLVIGYSAFAVVCLGFVFIGGLFSLIVLFILMGVSYAFVDGNQRAFVSDLAASDLRGTALGTFHTAISLATLTSSIVAGVLWEFLGPTATFIYGAGMTSIAILLLILKED